MNSCRFARVVRVVRVVRIQIASRSGHWRRRTTTKTRRSPSESALVDLSSQRRGQPPSWRVQPTRALLLYRNGTRGLLDNRDRFVRDSLLRGMRRAQLGRRSGAQVAFSRAARPFLYCAWPKDRFIFAPPRARLSRHLHIRHFARALRSGWAFCWRAPRAADCSLSLERKTGKCGHNVFRAHRRPRTKGRVASTGLRRTRKTTGPRPSEAQGARCANRK